MISLGIDIGGTQIKAAAFSESGEMLWKETSPTDDVPDCHPPRFALHVRALVEKLERHAGPAESVGISAPGLANASGSAISFMPGRMFGLENFDWPAWLGREVRVLNDAHAALLGESWQGSARGMRDVVLLTLGTGVGGAILVDGRLVRGHIGRAGHLGHMSLNPYGRPTISGTPGGLEDWIGNHNIVERSDGRFSTTHELIAAFEVGDTYAAEVWMKSIRALACAIASIANIIDPEAVIIGGGVAKAGTALFQPLREIMDEVEWRPGGARVRILPAKLGEWAGTYGAASTGAAR